MQGHREPDRGTYKPGQNREGQSGISATWEHETELVPDRSPNKAPVRSSSEFAANTFRANQSDSAIFCSNGFKLDACCSGVPADVTSFLPAMARQAVESRVCQSHPYEPLVVFGLWNS